MVVAATGFLGVIAALSVALTSGGQVKSGRT
jgi:hypothetical protein